MKASLRHDQDAIPIAIEADRVIERKSCQTDTPLEGNVRCFRETKWAKQTTEAVRETQLKKPGHLERWATGAMDYGKNCYEPKSYNNVKVPWATMEPKIQSTYDL